MAVRSSTASWKQQIEVHAVARAERRAAVAGRGGGMLYISTISGKGPDTRKREMQPENEGIPAGSAVAGR